MEQIMKLGIYLTSLLLCATFSTARAQMVFPTLTLDNLNGLSQTFPKDFPADPTIVFIAYKQNQQIELQAWIEALDLQETGGQAWVEFPVIGRGASLIRGFIDNGMRSGIKSSDLRAHVFTVYSSKGAFNQQLGIKESDQIYVALVGKNGTVYTLIEGEVTPEKAAQLWRSFP